MQLTVWASSGDWR